MGWRSTTIDGKPAEVFEPSAPRGFGILFLHNAKGQSLSVSPIYTQLLEHHRLFCVCPWGNATWWGNQILSEYDSQRSAECYLIQAVMLFMKIDLQLAPPAVSLFGISMGGQGALRIAFKHAQVFPVVAAVAPALDYHDFYGQGGQIDKLYTSKEQCRQDTAAMHLPPSDSPRHVFFCVDPDDQHWYRGADRLHEKMSALGAPHEVDLSTRAGGHSWNYFNAMANRSIEFMNRGLEIEARRLL